MGDVRHRARIIIKVQEGCGQTGDKSLREGGLAFPSLFYPIHPSRGAAEIDGGGGDEDEGGVCAGDVGGNGFVKYGDQHGKEGGRTTLPLYHVFSQTPFM